MDIYEPAEDSYLMKEFVMEFAWGRVLDMGTGSGIQALSALPIPNVREVLAVDVNENVINKLNKKIKHDQLRKIKVIQSDLFSNVTGQFNIVIFNSPYLPQDKGIEDKAIYGGRKGWEVSEKFFQGVSKHLFSDGKILYLFSSLTNKEKIEEILRNNLLKWKELGRKKFAFEELYVYLVEKTELLNELENKGVVDINYLTHGKRGNIFTGYFDRNQRIKSHIPKGSDKVKVGIKIERKESLALGKIENEIKWYKKLSEFTELIPRLLFYGENYFVYEFVEGVPILEWIKIHEKKDIIKILVKILNKVLTLDIAGVNKEEMHHPHKHIIVNSFNEPMFIDFERCSETDIPKNVTQFVEYLCRIESELRIKGIQINIEDMRKLAKEYKDQWRVSRNLDVIKSVFNTMINHIR
jgi:release factor glutamine methyltransferase